MAMLAGRDRYIEVEGIEGPGTYYIRKNPNLEPTLIIGDLKTCPDYYVRGDNPLSLLRELANHLLRTFPEMQRLVFEEARFFQGNLSAVSLDYQPLRLRFDESGDEGLVDLDGSLVSFAYRRSVVANGEEINVLDIQDRGSLRIVNNRLMVASPTRRDGQLSIWMNGRSHLDRRQGSMVGQVEFKGDRPGELIAESVDYISKFIRKKKISSFYKLPRKVKLRSGG